MGDRGQRHSPHDCRTAVGENNCLLSEAGNCLDFLTPYSTRKKNGNLYPFPFVSFIHKIVVFGKFAPLRNVVHTKFSCVLPVQFLCSGVQGVRNLTDNLCNLPQKLAQQAKLAENDNFKSSCARRIWVQITVFYYAYSVA